MAVKGAKSSLTESTHRDACASGGPITVTVEFSCSCFRATGRRPPGQKIPGLEGIWKRKQRENRRWRLEMAVGPSVLRSRVETLFGHKSGQYRIACYFHNGCT